MKKNLIITYSFILVFAIIFSPISVHKISNNAYATDTDSTEIEKEKFLAVIDVLQNGIDENINGLTLDNEYAKEKNLTPQEIQNLKNYLPEISKEDMDSIKEESKELKKEVNKKDDVFWIGELTASAAGKHAAPPTAFEKTLKAIFVTIVGVTVATQLVNDLYKLGAYSACHKWGKEYPKVKGACKKLGYW